MVKDDVLEGMTAVVTVRLAEPQFEGQTKEVLGTPAATRIVARSSRREMKTFLTLQQEGREAAGARRDGEGRQRGPHPRRGRASSATPSAARTPSSRARCPPSSPTAAATTWTAASCSSSRETPRSARPSWPATRSTRRCCRSAARSSTPRRSPPARCCRTPSAPSIIQVVGAGSGRTFDLEQARYGKIIFMADADTDGAHIRCLLATLFHKHMRGLLDRRAGSTPRCRRCTGSSCPTPRRAWTSTSTRTPTTSCSASSPS